MVWLAETFHFLVRRAPKEVVKHYTRVYILQMCKGILFVDKSGNLAHLMFLQMLQDFQEAGQYS